MNPGFQVVKWCFDNAWQAKGAELSLVSNGYTTTLTRVADSHWQVLGTRQAPGKSDPLNVFPTTPR